MNNIWNKKISLEELNEMGKNTAIESLGIKITKIGENSLEGEMPIDTRTHQIQGILHGGSSVLFAETLGSLAGLLAAKEGFSVVGLDINANHLRGFPDGSVLGIATAIHIGRTTQVWEIKISHKETKKLVCVSRLTIAVIKEV
jgi:1,4-dihydroxy-2-naphthoyl-CoA hydrolase